MPAKKAAAPAPETKKPSAKKTAEAELELKPAKGKAAAKSTTEDDKPKRGRKPKAATETAKSKAEVVAKAKPLRMKVSRAKERALMREFGLDETTAHRRGSRQAPPGAQDAHQDGQDAWFPDAPGNQRPPAREAGQRGNPRSHRVDAQRHGHRGVRAGARRRHAADRRRQHHTTATEEEAEEAAEAALSTVDSEFGRTTDPVRMYMREMGTVELLTREGEIEIAKRIEGGLQAMMLAISASPTTIAEILAMADKIAPARCRSPRWSTASSPTTRPTTTWPRRTSTSSTKKTTTTARAAARR
jgi:RNA polymerase primary sigma factor